MRIRMIGILSIIGILLVSLSLVGCGDEREVRGEVM